MDALYLIVVVCCFIRCVRTGAAQLVPCYAVSLAYLAVLELAYDPFSPEWLEKWYPVAVGGYMLMRLLAVAEAFLLHSYGHPKRKLIASSTVMLSLVCAAIMAWTVTGGSVVLAAIQARRVITVGLFAFLLIYSLLRWSMGEWRGGFASRHLLILLAISASLAVPSLLAVAGPKHWWGTIDTWAYGIRSLLLIAWAAYAIPGPPAVLAREQRPVSNVQSHA